MASLLESRIREHLKKRNNLFSEAAAGLTSSLNRPLLCLFDRNFELSVVRLAPPSYCYLDVDAEHVTGPQLIGT